MVSNNPEWRLKPLMRNNELYQLDVFAGRKKVLIFRDSLKLLPGSLSSLAKSLCPELGSKGEVDHTEVCLQDLLKRREEIVEYMKQDIYLLGGIMWRAQEIYWYEYKIDITKKITLPSLALTIFRKNYYDSEESPIYIPNNNAEQFIRRGYYGGHADVYIPRGENLYYYDVNSLYPFTMKDNPMPIGQAKWEGNLSKHKLDDLYGFL